MQEEQPLLQEQVILLPGPEELTYSVQTDAVGGMLSIQEQPAGEKDKDAALRLLDPMDISQVRSYFSDQQSSRFPLSSSNEFPLGLYLPLVRSSVPHREGPHLPFADRARGGGEGGRLNLFCIFVFFIFVFVTSSGEGGRLNRPGCRS